LAAKLKKMRVALLCVLVVLVAGVAARSSKLYPGFLASQQAANLHDTLKQRPFGNAPTHGPVTSLPGYGPVKQTQFAGYIGLNDTDGSQLWYWFIAADSPNWKQMPTVAWYQGGPGGSSLYGWFQENISPYGMTQDLRLTDNPNSWTRVANIICIDNPVVRFWLQCSVCKTSF
jgi:carboxypeptidase C (cathepsin A)